MKTKLKSQSQVLCSVPVSVHKGAGLPQLFTFFPSPRLLTTVSAPHFKLVVVMQRCSQIQTRCLSERLCLKAAHRKGVAVCTVSTTLTNFQAKRRGRKIGSI